MPKFRFYQEQRPVKDFKKWNKKKEWKHPSFLKKVEMVLSISKTLFRGSSYGGKLARLGGLARLGEITPSLRNSSKNIDVAIWEVSQPA